MRFKTQDPKYDIEVEMDQDSPSEAYLVNTETGKPIPEDEPIFIFRAKDKLASQPIAHYRQLVPTSEHKECVLIREREFIKFSRDFPKRMKMPDTILKY